MTTNQVLLGVGLILALAASSQVLASLLKIPAIIILLPAGFVTGAITSDAQRPGHGVVAPYTGGEILFDAQLTRYELSRRYADGARIRLSATDGGAAAGGNLLFVVRADGRLAPVTRSGPPESQAGDTMVMLGQA